MAAGRIVIATNLPAVAEYLNTGTGILIPAPPRGSEIACAVFSAINMNDWDRTALAAREAARSFCWREANLKLSGILEGIVQKSSWGFYKKDSALSNELCDTATSVAKKIVAGCASASVFLLGSAARGFARPGSDIDLLVLNDDLAPAGQKWHFTDNAPIDVRIVPLSRIHNLSSMSRDSFAESVDRDPLPDYLCGARPLTQIPDPLAVALALIQHRRFERETVELIVKVLLFRADSFFLETLEAADQAAQADSQTRLNSGAQALLQATLVSEGWVIQGAKRRPELAVEYSRRSFPVWAACSFLIRAVGIDDITLDKAAQYIRIRTRLRTEHLRCLELLHADADVIELARRHATGSTDYYSAAISNGFIRGCMNHMRSLSGIPLLPPVYVKALNLNPSLPVRSFLECPNVSNAVKDLWQEIVDPHPVEKLKFYAVQGISLVRKFGSMKVH